MKQNERESKYQKFNKEFLSKDINQQQGSNNHSIDVNLEQNMPEDEKNQNINNQNQLQNDSRSSSYQRRLEKGQDNNIRCPSPLDESCLIFSENNIRKRMALSLPREEDQTQLQCENNLKGDQKNQPDNKQVIPIQLKFAIEREKIYEQNLKLLKQCPDVFDVSIQKQTQKNEAQIYSNNSPAINKNEKILNSEENKSVPTNITKLDVLVNQFSSNTQQKDQKLHQTLQNQISNNLNQGISSTSPPLLPSPVVNTPYQIHNLYQQQQQQHYGLNLNNNPCLIGQYSNIENTSSYIQNPNLITIPISQFQQLPIYANTNPSNYSSNSNISSQRSMNNSNSNCAQNQQYSYEQETAFQFDPLKKQLCGLFQQYSNSQQPSPNQQKMHSPSPPEINLSKNIFLTPSYHYSPPKQANNYLDCNPNILHQPNNIASSGEINQSQNHYNQTNSKVFFVYSSINFILIDQKQDHSSEMQKSNIIDSNLMKAVSEEIESVNNTSRSSATNNNQQNSSNSKNKKGRQNKIPSDDTYNYIQMLFQMEANNLFQDSNQQNSRILQNSNNIQSHNIPLEKLKYNDENFVSMSSFNSNSSTSLKQKKSLSSAIEDDATLAEKSKQKLKEKQLLYLCKELSQNKKVQSLELKEEKNKIISDINYCSQTSYKRQQCAMNLSEEGEANPLFNFSSKKRLSLILQQSLISKIEEAQQDFSTPKNVEYETCSSLDINDQ